jgi:putative NIF3 family GTP cyclohydrolase 1 type 2
LADKLELDVAGFIEPNINYENYGMGVMAIPRKLINRAELLERVKSVCNSPLRYCNGISDNIGKIAIVGGSGSSFIDSVMKTGADAFITADVTYHKFHQAAGKMMIIDPGHYEMEQFVPQGLQKLLIEKMNKEDYNSIVLSKVLTNPVNYFPDSEDYLIMQKNYLINNNNKMV